VRSATSNKAARTCWEPHVAKARWEGQRRARYLSHRVDAWARTNCVRSGPFAAPRELRAGRADD
jgi:hypothetical protein